MLIKYVRIIRLIWRIHVGLFLVTFMFPFASSNKKWHWIKCWSQKIVAILGFEIEVVGSLDVGERSILFVSNHISWVDILIVLSLYKVIFVSKEEVKFWPFVGYLARKCGTLFIRREKLRDALRLNHEIAELLHANQKVLVFPEGTTSAGGGLLPFHSSLLQPAIDCDALVIPITVSYMKNDNSLDYDPAFVGDTTFMGSLMKIANRHQSKARLTVLSPIEVNGMTRSELSRVLRKKMGTTLNLIGLT